MHRTLLAVALSCAIPACALAQQASAPNVADQAPAAATARKPHSAFGQLMSELTRAAREKAGTPTAAAPATPDSAPAQAPRTAATPAPATVVAPALADSSGG